MADANTLDDYEEGSWTPVLTDLTNDATTNLGYGSYVKVGSLVTYKFYLVTSSLGSVSGVIYVSGLPFTSSSTPNSYSSAVAGTGNGFAVTAGVSVTGLVSVSDTNILLYRWAVTTGSTVMASTQWTDDGSIMMTGTYTV